MREGAGRSARRAVPYVTVAVALYCCTGLHAGIDADGRHAHPDEAGGYLDERRQSCDRAGATGWYCYDRQCSLGNVAGYSDWCEPKRADDYDILDRRRARDPVGDGRRRPRRLLFPEMAAGNAVTPRTKIRTRPSPTSSQAGRLVRDTILKQRASKLSGNKYGPLAEREDEETSAAEASALERPLGDVP